jgi:hypothetical protein
MKLGDRVTEVPASTPHVDLEARNTAVRLSCSNGKPGIEAAWVVALADEPPPPPPEPWKGGLSDDD